MARQRPGPGGTLLRAWRLCRRLPGGGWLFGRIVGWMAPYSGSVRPRVAELDPGRARLWFPDRRGVRNHLDSVHAVALINLGELATGLATLTALPEGVRGIVVELSCRYEKKARGRMSAECRSRPPEVGPEALEHEATAEIVDPDGDVVARVTSTWRLQRPG